MSFRPTVYGQVVDAQTGDPVPGAVVTVQELINHGTVRHRPDMTEPPQSGDKLVERPEALVCATTYGDGKFWCKGQQDAGFLIESLRLFRVHVRRDDYADGTYDFFYYVQTGSVFGPAKKTIGLLKLSRP